MKYQKEIFMIVGMVLVTYGTFQSLVSAIVGLAILMFSVFDDFKYLKVDLLRFKKETNERFKTKEQFDKVWREIDLLKMEHIPKTKRGLGKRGHFDTGTALIITIIILVLMWLWKAGVLQ
ncbi:MAG: hypothetical protein KKG60_00030, partial [Nanoarchaeota archaeon]|nr:hypothetical protein [Nanoarchaeota archaeon]